ncbi:hypothetical protein RB2654_17781 [Rhodobacterales bacterium HTCC2654]|uniref:Uncharacterized protein n=1 Tax=Maritimibacter alkaliphilus HTCC2654 TaxID=314271 RepID=A3VC61_9RHOB|nr:hypothetical protein RB2654_17781 [Rhodobacterales bacterium HTCC2654] [Maritimibacter alkaliphilus HTCC2654]
MCFARLDDLARLHHHHPVGDRAHDGQVMGDEDIGQPMLGLKPRDEVEDLGADRHVERRDRLVQHDQFGARDERARDGDALTLAAGEFVNVTAHRIGGEAHVPEHLGHPFAPVGGRRGHEVEGFGHQTFDPPARVERGVGVLEHDLNAGAQGVREIRADPFAEGVDRAALNRVEAQNGAGERGFAAAGFTHEAKAFARVQLERHLVHGAERVRAAEQTAPPAGIFAHHAREVEDHVVRRQGAALGLVRCRGEQALCVVMPHPAKERFGRVRFDDLALFHHRDLIGHARDHGKVVGDEEQRHAALIHQFVQQVEDLRLRGDVERGRRFVGDEKLGRKRDGHCDGDALALTAGQFVREARQREAVRGQAHAGQFFGGDAMGLGARGLAVDEQGLGHLIADGLDRVQRRHRLLKDHADPVAPDAVQLFLARVEQVPVVQHDPPGDLGAPGLKAHDGEGGHGLARAAFAHERGHLARCDVERHMAQDRRLADGKGQIFDPDHARPRLSRGSVRSRRPSPMRLRPSTIATMARPGQRARRGAV